eukprot:TRINITY_DN33080_c0_g1_i1.p2 TRINITY_DN33080_c0_g1~~TRINITY_DN33080_c0_g1_i1.p2  ORF type:complete len:131 (-),score=38.87 TRINITY_DN33080_c0_g1_i1:105-497(-)
MSLGGSQSQFQGASLPNERYKLCRIVCEKRNGWTLKSFCQASYSAVCTQQWRNGYQAKKCVSPYVEWSEKIMQETGSCVDATVKTRGKKEIPEADQATKAFCVKRCEDAFDREYDWQSSEVWEVCRQQMT